MITVNSTDFQTAATFASAVVERRHCIPVFTMMKVVANGSLNIEATDLDTFVRAEIPYDGEEGEFLIPEPQKLMKAVKVSGAEEVSFSQVEKILNVEAGELKADLLASIPADDYPNAAPIAEELFTATVGADFFKTIDRVRPAISTEETHYYLNGVFVQKIGDWDYRLVATDGHRLFIATIPLPDADGDLPEVIIPRRALEKAIKVFKNAPDGVKLAFGSTQKSNKSEATLAPEIGVSRAGFSGDVSGARLTLTTKLIHGTYPDYARVISSKVSFTIRMDKAALRKAIRSLTPLSTDKTRALRLTAEKGRVLVELHSPDIGKSKFPVAAEHKAPKGFEIGLNARYLLDAIGSLNGDEIEFGCDDAASPIIITDPADTTFKIIQMPMRI